MQKTSALLIYDIAPVSYTHLDVYKRQLLVLCNFSAKTISLPEPVAYTPPDLLLSNLPEHTPNVLRPYEAVAIRR